MYSIAKEQKRMMQELHNNLGSLDDMASRTKRSAEKNDNGK